MPWDCRLSTHAARALRRCAAAALLGLALAACEATPEPRIATPSAVEVAVMQAAQEASPSPTPPAVEPAVRVRTRAPTPRALPRPSPTPTATSTPTPAATPMPTPTPEPLDDQVTTHLQEAADLIERVSGSPAALQAGPDLRAPLEAAGLALLARHGSDPQAAARLDHAIGQLPPLVYDLAPQGARIAAADVDGDGQNELIAAWHIVGMPPIWFDQDATGFSAYAFPVGPFAATPAGMTVIHSTADLTGDGVADVLLVSTIRSESTQTEHLRVYTWDNETPRRVFDVPVVLGGGPAGWELRDTALPPAIETTCPALGHFAAPLLPSPGLHRTFAWDGRWFSEVARRLDPPVSLRDQINRAEAAFWAGRYADAEAGYLAVIETAAIGESQTGTQPDWQGLAYLRLTQVALLQGQFSDPTHLRAVIDQGGALGLIGEVMRSGAANPDPLPTFAALQTLNLSGDLPPGPHGSIEFPMDPALVLALGKALEIGLLDVGSSELAVDTIVDRLGADGLRIRSAAVGDLNRDGVLEAVVSISRHSARALGPPQNEFWFVSRIGTRWVTQPVAGIGLGAVAAGARDVSQGRSVFAFSEPGSAREFYLSFDGRRLATWTRVPTLQDLYPANPFDGREIRNCEISA